MTLASKITMIRLLFIPLFILLMYLSGGESGLWMWLSLTVFILASLTDLLDGHIARRYNQVSDFGKFLDPLADKLLTISAMTMFCEWGMMPAWILMLVLSREFAVTGLRLIAAGKGNVIAAGWSGKVKTTVTMISLCVLMVFPAVDFVPIVVNVLIVATTVYSGVEYFVVNWKYLWQN
jgi:CDP-diacylglycerol--glycerol-3-phosphate 3-phosphatidyltransferase